VEDGGVENSRFWYLLFYHDDVPVGAVVLSSFAVSLDLLTDKWFQKVVKLLKRWVPHFLRVDILFCGLPVSIGKHTIAIPDMSCSQKVLGLLVREMTEIAREEQIQILCVKEFLEGDRGFIDSMTQYRFFCSPSLPYMNMEIRWREFQSYLAEMRHAYRRPILRSVRKLGESRPVIQRRIPSTEMEKPVLVLVTPASCPPRRFYELYLEVMKRAKIKLEILNEAFFENIYKNLKNEMEILAVINKGQVLSTAMLTVYKGTMTFLLAGLDYSERDEHDAYFNLLYGIVALAIERGCVCLELGQTPYWVKQRLGAKPTASYLYIREEHWYFNCVLKLFRPFLFPEIKLQRLHIFR